MNISFKTNFVIYKQATESNIFAKIYLYQMRYEKSFTFHKVNVYLQIEIN